jgi:hypothetical protein
MGWMWPRWTRDSNLLIYFWCQITMAETKWRQTRRLSTIFHHRKWSVDQQKPNFRTNDKFYSLIYTCEKYFIGVPITCSPPTLVDEVEQLSSLLIKPSSGFSVVLRHACYIWIVDVCFLLLNGMGGCLKHKFKLQRGERKNCCKMWSFNFI